MAYPSGRRLDKQLHNLQNNCAWPGQLPKHEVRQEFRKFRYRTQPANLSALLEGKNFDHRITTSLFSLINLSLCYKPDVNPALPVQANRIFAKLLEMTIYEATIVSIYEFFIFIVMFKSL